MLHPAGAAGQKSPLPASLTSSFVSSSLHLDRSWKRASRARREMGVLRAHPFHFSALAGGSSAQIRPRASQVQCPLTSYAVRPTSGILAADNLVETFDHSNQLLVRGAC